jgi:hypothetical protein
MKKPGPATRGRVISERPLSRAGRDQNVLTVCQVTPFQKAVRAWPVFVPNVPMVPTATQ